MFTVIFDQVNESLLNKSIIFFLKNLTDPKPLNNFSLYVNSAVLWIFWWTLPLRCMSWCPLIGLFDLISVISFSRQLLHILPNVFTIYASCVAESAVRFDGKGYLKYLYQMEEGKEKFHLSLRLKASAAEGTVMSTNASDWAKLEVRHFSNTLTKESLTS